MAAIYPHIFTPYRIGSHVLKNRIFAAPTTRHTLQDNDFAFTEGSFEYYIEKAKGGVALFTVGAVLFDIGVKSRVGGPEYDLTNALTQRAFRHLTEQIHVYVAKVTLELLYLGPQRRTREESLKETVYGVCNDVLKNGVITKELSEEQLTEVADRYAKTARLAQECVLMESFFMVVTVCFWNSFFLHCIIKERISMEEALRTVPVSRCLS